MKIYRTIRFISLLVSFLLCGNANGTTVTENIQRNAFESRDMCRKPVKNSCQKLQFLTCFGVKLPYDMTSNELVNENFTQQQLQNEMSRWEGLRNSPRCWAVIQPLLCSIYMPKCHDNFVDLPSQELCKITRSPCRIIEQATKDWPDFLKCDDFVKFPPNCKNNEIRELRFNTSTKCMEPMVEVDSSKNNYEGFEGCALKCRDPLFTAEDHEIVSSLIKYFGIATLFANGFVIATFAIDWKSSRAYPSVIILYVNIAYFIATCGWMVQFLPNAKEDIVCRKDGTLRRGEPSGTENVFCLLVFLLIYGGTTMALAWLVVFSYVWHLTCNGVGRIRERIDKQKVYFRIFTCFATAVLIALSCAVTKLDGNSISGICFVGYYDYGAKMGLVLAPIGAAGVIMSVNFGMGAWRLRNVSLSSSDFISPRGRAEIKSNAMRVVLFAVLGLITTTVAICLQINEMQARPIWENSFRESLLCKMNLTDVAECGLSEKPILSQITVSIICYFCGGILVSSWAWTSASWRTWRRFVRRRCGSETSDQHQPPMQKHKLISKAFAKRHQLPLKGRLSLSLYSTHEDPVGFNKMVDPTHLCHNMDDAEQSQHLNNTNTEAREDISSEWAAALPHLVSRRGALIPPHSSNSVSCVSEDSRRPSCDSAMSELAARNLQSSGSVHDRSEYKKSRRRDWFRMARRSRSSKWGYPWRRGTAGSSSSLESNPGSQPQILPAITALIDKRLKLSGDDPQLMHPNNLHGNKAIIMKEFAVQTSLEKLTLSPKSVKIFNASNNLTWDKATQSSLLSLHEIGTQTKKSATKKKDKDKDKSQYKERDGKSGKETRDKDKVSIPIDPDADDPVLKLLTPN